MRFTGLPPQMHHNLPGVRSLHFKLFLRFNLGPHAVRKAQQQSERLTKCSFVLGIWEAVCFFPVFVFVKVLGLEFLVECFSFWWWCIWIIQVGVLAWVSSTAEHHPTMQHIRKGDHNLGTLES